MPATQTMSVDRRGMDLALGRYRGPELTQNGSRASKII